LSLPLDFRHKYDQDGLFVVQKLFSEETIASLAEITDHLMSGQRKLNGMFFQLDPNSESYADVDFSITTFQGASLNYRKIKDLEYIPEFLEAIQVSDLRAIVNDIIGLNVSSMRYMIVNKPSKSKTPLPWHQDISAKWPMSGTPEMTIWIALDDVDESNGCVEWILGSHKLGEIEGGHLTSEDAINSILSTHDIFYGVLKRGDAVVFNNGVIHRSKPNFSGKRRRGLTLCLMDSKIFNTDTKTFYPTIFGENELKPKDVASIDKIPSNRPVDFGE
jgi:ectoine hydroxylase-related dioxygenase (phytanoyl-CoA dioxygenase family)